MKNAAVFDKLLTGLLVLFLGCKGAKIAQQSTTEAKQVAKEISTCDRTIRYYSEKAKGGNGQQVEATIEITIDPTAKTVDIMVVTRDGKHQEIQIVVEYLECTFNSDLTQGAATYSGYIKQQDGSTTKTSMKVAYAGDVLTISNADPNRTEEFFFVITKWELVQ
jgi:hypothetical protein